MSFESAMAMADRVYKLASATMASCKNISAEAAITIAYRPNRPDGGLQT